MVSSAAIYAQKTYSVTVPSLFSNTQLDGDLGGYPLVRDNNNWVRGGIVINYPASSAGYSKVLNFEIRY